MIKVAIAAVFAVVVAGIATAPVAEAQVRPWEDYGYVNINYAYQSGDRAFAESLSAPIFGETATYGASHVSGGGGGLDIGAGVRVASVSGEVPNPLFFNRPRPVAVDLTGLEYQELGVHLQAVWVLPLSEKVIVSVGGGPSFFNVDQSLLGAVTVGQETAPFDRVSIAASSVTASKAAVGGNVGVDVTYMFTEQLGGGAFVRWTGGSLDLPAAGGAQSIDVGGVQSGAGLRVSF
jgi:hypothetical protein